MIRVLAEAAAAAAMSVTALTATAGLLGRGALRPLNATSHWLNGDGAADETAGSWRTTGVGLLTHVAATGFWAALFELWLRRVGRSRREIAGKAAAMAGVAALVDYRATPKRFTPGWELMLPPSAMAAAYFAMGAGFALASGVGSSPARAGREFRRVSRLGSVAAGDPCDARAGELFSQRRLELDSLPPSQWVEVRDELRQQANTEARDSAARLVSALVLVEAQVRVAGGLAHVEAPATGAARVLEQCDVDVVRRAARAVRRRAQTERGPRGPRDPFRWGLSQGA